MRTVFIALGFIAIFIFSAILSYINLEHLKYETDFSEKHQAHTNTHQADAGIRQHSLCDHSAQTGHLQHWPMHVLVTGAGSSVLGHHMTQHLLTAGHHVTTSHDISHNPQSDAHFQQVTKGHHLNSDSCLQKYSFDNHPKITHIVFNAYELDVDGKSILKQINSTLYCLTYLLEKVRRVRNVHVTLLTKIEIAVWLRGELDEASALKDTEFLIQSALVTVLRFYHSTYGVPVSVVGLPYVYGPGVTPAALLWHLVEAAESSTLHTANKRLHTFYTKHKYSSHHFVHVNDTIAAIYKVLLLRPKCELYHVVSSQPITLQSLLRITQNTIDAKIIKPGIFLEKHLLYNFDKVSTVHFNAQYQKSNIPEFSPEVSIENGIKEYVSWHKNSNNFLLPGSAKDYVFTSYLTSNSDPQRRKHIQNNNFSYMKTWYFSLQALNLNGVVFHDGLSPLFKSKIKLLSFQHSTLNGRSTNDARFYTYLRYLMKHPEIQRVLLTDISDVEFKRNPFDLMSLLGDHLYIGTDIDLFPNLASMGWLTKRLIDCFGKEANKHGELAHLKMLNIVYNAGVIGGSRGMVLQFLQRVTEMLDETPHGVNCNMPVVNYVVHKYFDDVVYTGFPLSSRFMKHQQNPKGVYIIHK